VLCVRARGAVVRRKVASNVVLSLFPFPLWRAAFPFSLETHPIPFPLRRPSPQSATQLQLALSQRQKKHLNSTFSYVVFVIWESGSIILDFLDFAGFGSVWATSVKRNDDEMGHEICQTFARPNGETKIKKIGA